MNYTFIGTEKFYLKVGGLLYKKGADVGLRPDGMVVKSDAERIEAEPKGMQQRIMIDVRGQSVTKTTFEKIQQKIAEKCNGVLNETDIKWIGEFAK